MAKSKEHTFGSSLLIPEHPIVLSPTLACVIGDRQAIALQQIHYWLDINRKAKKRDTHFRDGRWWTYNTYAEWEGSFPFWSRRTIRRMINELEEKGLLLSEQFGARKGDQTKWYTIDYDLLDFYLEQRDKSETLGNTELSKLDTHEDKMDTHLAKMDTHEDKVDNSLQRIHQRLHPENSSETFLNIKASGNAGSGKKENFEVDITNEGSKANGGASLGSNPDSCGGGENDSHSQNKGLYDRVWNPNTEGFRVDSRGWAVLPPTPKFKLANYMATRGMQLEVLNIMDSDFTADWNEAESQLYITTSYGDAGFEDDILGTVASVGTNWVEYENDDICQPGNNSLRLLRDWGYKEGEFDQDWFNTRLKELWDEAVTFCAEHGKNAKALFKSRPAWCSLSINIDFDDEES